MRAFVLTGPRQCEVRDIDPPIAVAGGVVIDVPSGQAIVRGLSMPHSPRWHQGKLWVLESGNGGFGTVDERSGTYQEICRLPGFSRGLDFAGPYAFIGLSQVRESATFSGIAIAEMKQEDRCCGVWVVDTRNGQIVGFVKFTDAVQEVFAVQVMADMLWPDVLSEDAKRIAESYELPDEAMNQVPEALRDTSGRSGDIKSEIKSNVFASETPIKQPNTSVPENSKEA